MAWRRAASTAGQFVKGVAFKPSVRRYVGSLVAGNALTAMGEHAFGQHAQPSSAVAGPLHSDDVFGHAQQRLQARRDVVQGGSTIGAFGRSLDVRQWEVPHHIHRVRTLARYAKETSASDMGADVRGVAVQKTKDAAKKVFTAPVEAYHDGRKGLSVIGGLHREGVSGVKAQLNAHVGLEKAAATRQMGMNMMLGAPAFLIPGVAGFAVRSFMAAKTVGNLGHSINQVHRATGKESGVLMQAVHKRLGTTPVAEPKPKPKS